MKTFSVVNRNKSATSCTAVFVVLASQQFPDSRLMDQIQVFSYTHAIIFTVSAVQTIDLFAGVLITCKTKMRLAGWYFMVDTRTFSKQIGARLVFGSATDTLTPLQSVTVSQISAANRAADSARCNQFFRNGNRGFHAGYCLALKRTDVINSIMNP